MAEEIKKVLVAALEGVSGSEVYELARAGKLPNLQRLMDSGTAVIRVAMDKTAPSSLAPGFDFPRWHDPHRPPDALCLCPEQLLSTNHVAKAPPLPGEKVSGWRAEHPKDPTRHKSLVYLVLFLLRTELDQHPYRTLSLQCCEGAAYNRLGREITACPRVGICDSERKIFAATESTKNRCKPDNPKGTPQAGLICCLSSPDSLHFSRYDTDSIKPPFGFEVNAGRQYTFRRRFNVCR